MIKTLPSGTIFKINSVEVIEIRTKGEGEERQISNEPYNQVNWSFATH